MKHLSYFVALAVIGSFLALLAMEPVVAIARVLIASVLGWPEETVKTGVNLVVASIWMLGLIGHWVRRRGLAPQAIKVGRKSMLVLGHLCLILGHVLIASVFLVKALAFFMILPAIGVLALYGAGMVLIECARDRSPKGGKDGRCRAQSARAPDRAMSTDRRASPLVSMRYRNWNGFRTAACRQPPPHPIGNHVAARCDRQCMDAGGQGPRQRRTFWHGV